MNRRVFLQGMAGILAAGAAPAVLPSGVIMPIRAIATRPPCIVITGKDGIDRNITEWSLDGLQWSEDHIALLEKRAAPAFIFQRIWMPRSEFARLFKS